MAVLPLHCTRPTGVRAQGQIPAACSGELAKHFSTLPFTDLELTEVDRRLREAGLADPAAQAKVLAEDPGRLRSVLGVDAVVVAESPTTTGSGWASPPWCRWAARCAW